MADVSTICSAVAAAYLACQQPTPTLPPAPTAAPTVAPAPQPTAVPTLPAGAFLEPCDAPAVVEESSTSSPDWLVNSGGRFFRGIAGTCQSIHGDLPVGDKWRTAYARANPTDTDKGLHPQNIGRYVTRKRFQNYVQRVRFRIDKTSASASPNRNASNGVLMFNRYQDEDRLYYAGIRVDGALVIKKKTGPVATGYNTLASRKVLAGTWNKTSAPNLIPQWQWHDLKVEVSTTPQGCAVIAVTYDTLPPLSATDCGAVGGPPITAAGYAGLRVDFMDMSYDDYSVTPR